MDIAKFASKATKFAGDNAPTILTAVGIVGTVTTAVLTHKAAFKAHEILLMEDAKRQLHEIEAPVLSNTDIVKLVWKEYIPPVAVAAVTITAILGANRISTSRAAALAAAYKLSEKQINEYKDKVVEKFTPAKEKELRDEIAQDRVTANPPTALQSEVSSNESLCYEAYTGRYFKSSVNAIEKARNDLNMQLIDNTYATLGDFYERIGLEPTSIANEFGWNLDCPLELSISATIVNGTQPCIVVEYRKLPFPIREHYFQAE